MNSCQHGGPALFVMCNMCVMMTEIYTVEGGHKDVSSLEGTTLKKVFLKCQTETVTGGFEFQRSLKIAVFFFIQKC